MGCKAIDLQPNEVAAPRRLEGDDWELVVTSASDDLRKETPERVSSENHVGIGKVLTNIVHYSSRCSQGGRRNACIEAGIINKVIEELWKTLRVGSWRYGCPPECDHPNAILPAHKDGCGKTEMRLHSSISVFPAVRRKVRRSERHRAIGKLAHPGCLYRRDTIHHVRKNGAG